MFAIALNFITSKFAPWVIIALLAVGGWFLLDYKNTKIELEQQKNAQLIGIVSAKELEIKKKNEDIELIRQLNVEVSKKWAVAVSEKTALQKKFTENSAGKPRDFTAISAADPKVMEDKINRGTRYALRCNEIVTGSPVKETDKDNNICPDLVRKKTP